MFRATDIVLVAAMVAAAAFTYKTKHDAERELAALRKLEAQIRLEQETIDLLKADWSLLTQPSRLQKLVEVYQDELDLQPVEATQIVGLDELPMRPLTIEELTSGPDGEVADLGRDETTTGSTGQ